MGGYPPTDALKKRVDSPSRGELALWNRCHISYRSIIMTHSPHPFQSSFGRNRGRALRTQQQSLVDTLLPKLAVSVEAVRTHMKALFKLFEVPDLPQNRKRAELARRALAAGVILPRDL